jgi:hypothetical protein
MINKMEQEPGPGGYPRWSARATLLGTDIRLTSQMRPSLYNEDVARSAFSHALVVISDKHAEIVSAIADALLATYNETWRDGPSLSRDQFCGRLRIERIDVSEPDNPSRLITLILDDDGLFGGHQIEHMLEWDGRPLGEPSLRG